MTVKISQKESSLGMRIYLYIIALVCLSANVWFSYQLDKQTFSKQQKAKQQKANQLARTPQLTRNLTQENKNPLIAVKSSEVVSTSNHAALE